MGRSPVAVEAAAGPYRIFTASTMGVGGEPWGWMGGREGESLDKWDCLGWISIG